MRDRVDVILEQWAHARPDLDASPMGVLGRLSRVSRLTEKRLQAIFAEHGLQPGEFDILATIRRAAGPGGMTAGALAEAAMVTSGAITNRVDRLVAKNLVTRELDPGNRRTTLIDLTPSGRDLIDQAVVDHVANEQHTLAALTPRQQQVLADLLRRLLLSLDDAAHRPDGD
ncbi:MAG: MarR family winged helix-turn-helix transcriptional regulator [Nocardioidaceae bacterium]